jgi:hypothetical protein
MTASARHSRAEPGTGMSRTQSLLALRSNMAMGGSPDHAGWWIWSALSFDALVVALSLIALRLAETSTTDRQEGIAFRAIEAVAVTACAAAALSVQALRSSSADMSPARRIGSVLTLLLLCLVLPLGLFAAWIVYWVYTS